MSVEGGQFLEACGARGPLELEWDDWESGEAVRRVFERPAVLVGRGTGSDLLLPHPLVGRRHAYLQLVEGRLFAVDLGRREGLRWSGVPRRSGWVERRRPMQLGPTTIRVVESGEPGGEEPGAGPGPLSSRYVGHHPLPAVLLRIAGPSEKPIRMAMDRVLALVGSSPDCQVQLPEPGTSRYACALVRTTKGVWMVDLLSSRGVTLNGVACRQARLEDGDMIRIGGQSIRLTYDGAPIVGSRARTAPGSLRPGDGPLLPAPVDLSAWPGGPPGEADQGAWELVPELILGRLRGAAGPAPEASDPFQHALLMLLRMLGDIHRDHLELVRGEMEQIRRLNREMGSLRAQLPRPDPTAVDPEGPARAPETGEGPRPSPVDAHRDRPTPEAVQALVGERLAAWEKERQSRWRKVVDLLVKT